MWEELLKDVVIIKWVAVSIAVPLWAVTIYYILKEILKWRGRFNKEKPFTLEQMKKDLAGAERPAVRYPKEDNWGG